jgi:hypothetical protein
MRTGAAIDRSATRALNQRQACDLAVFKLESNRSLLLRHAMLLQWPSPQASEALARVEAVAAEIAGLTCDTSPDPKPRSSAQFTLAEETFVDHFAKALAKTGSAFQSANFQSDLFEKN